MNRELLLIFQHSLCCLDIELLNRSYWHPCLRHMRQIASPGCLLHQFKISSWSLQPIYCIWLAWQDLGSEGLQGRFL